MTALLFVDCLYQKCVKRILEAWISRLRARPKGFAVALWKPSQRTRLFIELFRSFFADKHAGTLCQCHQLNREKGVERVEDPSRVQGRALPESRGRASGASLTPVRTLSLPAHTSPSHRSWTCRFRASRDKRKVSHRGLARRIVSAPADRLSCPVMLGRAAAAW